MALTNDYDMQSYAGHFESDGAAYDITIPFDPDSFKWWNYTKFATDQNNAFGVWFKDMPAGDALIVQSIINDGGNDARNTILETTNGITINNTASGVTAYRATISGATAADPVVITATAHGFGSAGDVLRARITKVVGMSELNDELYQITIIDANSFSLQDPHTGEDVDGTNFTAYSSGGQANLVTRTTDNSKAVEDSATVYKLTLGTAVMGADGDEIYFEAMLYNKREDLGDIA